MKTAVYSFIISFLLQFVLIPRTKSTTDVNGMTSFVEASYPDFFFSLACYSILASLIIVVVMYFVKVKSKK